MWNKPTGLSEFLSFMSQIDVIILQHLPFSLPVTQKSWATTATNYAVH